MLDVVALGELLIDFTCLSMDEAGYPTIAAHPGGAPANYLAALSQFGARTALLGKVGKDTFGRLLVDTLRKNGIETQGVITAVDVFTTLAFVTLDEKGEREFSFARKPGADTCLKAEELDLPLIDQANVFHFGSLSLTHEPARTATVKAVEYAKAHGKLISYDPNLRKPLWDDLDMARKQLLWGLSQADVVKISEEECEFLFGLDPAKSAEHILARYGVKVVYITCGAEGCFYKNKQACGWVPALSGLHVADTTGAGDIFGGSAMWKLLQTGKAPEDLKESELREIVVFANAAAGLSTTKPGGISSVPEYEAVLEKMEELR